MDKVKDITKLLATKKQQETVQDSAQIRLSENKISNPIFRKLMQFKNQNLSKKFDINDLLR